MSAHSEEVINKFCELCERLMQAWQMRKFLFDENPNVDALQTPRHGNFFHVLQTLLQENWLHQLAKLHDPAVQGGQKGHINLSLDYVIEYGQWDVQTKSKLEDLKLEMLGLAKPIRDARNKILSHNDLAVLLQSKELGGFSPGADEKYFQVLCEFASLVRQSSVGKPFVFDGLVKNDVEAFMQTFLLGASAQQIR